MRADYLEIIEKTTLKTGTHNNFEEGACILELVSYIANEPWSDHPKCACPIITEYAIRINDRFNDEHRQLLKPVIPLLLNSKADKKTQIARRRLIIWRNVTAIYPLILEYYELPESAKELRKFKNTVDDMNLATKFLIVNKKKICTRTFAYTDGYTDAYTNSCSYDLVGSYALDYAYAYAYTNTYAYAGTYANKLRKDLAAASIETLRMACEVKLDTLREEEK